MRTLIVISGVFFTLLTSPLIRADEALDPARHAATIAPLITEQTVGLVHIDLERLEAESFVALLAVMVPEVRADREAMTGRLAALQAAYLATGARHVYLVVTLADLKYPWLLAQAGEKIDEKALEQLLRTLPLDSPGASAPIKVLKSVLQGQPPAPRAVPMVLDLAPMGDLRVCCSPAIAESIRQFGADPRPELTEAFREAGDAAIQIFLLPPKHTERVVREMMPELPQRAGGGPSSLLTQGVRWAMLAVSLSPGNKVGSETQPTGNGLRLVVQSASPEAAGALRERAETLLVAGLPPALVEVARPVLPKVEGDRLVLELDLQQLQPLASAFTPPPAEPPAQTEP